MQLDPAKKSTALRDALHTAALALMLVPAVAKAEDAKDHIDVTSLLYTEQSRTQVVEPVVRFSHILPDGQTISAQLGIDVITGASPTGALPSGTVQTRTSASGRTITSPAGALPTAPFSDRRVALDADWTKPWGRFVTSTLGGHFSREKDYQSTGVNGKLSFDVDRRLFTLTLGGGVNHDTVFPVGGTPGGLTTGTILYRHSNPKTVSTATFGISHVMSRRWLLGLDASRTFERGYLTEPYKLVSVMNPVSGAPVLALTDKRPDTRDRSAFMLSSVYHFTDDVLYSSYRYYWDTWNIRSHTIDLKYRHFVGDEDSYVEPLLRFYTQSKASFYTIGLDQALPLPQYATSDYRLGALKTITIGGTFGFHMEESPGLWTLRAEFMRQSGNSSPPNAIGIQRRFDLSPPVNIFAIAVGYSFDY